MNTGILLLEGGAFRGMYTAGVLDALMEADIRLDVAGVSAGSLTGCNYISRQPDRSRRINLAHRHDPNYVGVKAVKRSHSIIGFDYLLHDLKQTYPFDEETFFSSPQKFYCVATDIDTGLPVVFDRDVLGQEIFTAIVASSSLPMVSEPVAVGNHFCLDGGAAVAIPLQWAISAGYEKIVVVRTRHREYRKPEPTPAQKAMYAVRYPAKPNLRENLATVSQRYNALCDQLVEQERAGRIFTLAPEKPVTVERLEDDLSKLQQFYLEGVEETKARLDALRAYLEAE